MFLLFRVRLILSSVLVLLPAILFLSIFKPNAEDDFTSSHDTEAYSYRTVGALFSELGRSLSLQRATTMCVSMLKSGNVQFVGISSRSVINDRISSMSYIFDYALRLLTDQSCKIATQ